MTHANAAAVLAEELEAIRDTAAAEGLQFLAYLIDVACLEAELISKGAEP